MESVIRLFRAVPITSKRKKNPSKHLLKKTIEKGFIFAPEVVYNYSTKELNSLIKVLEKEVGLSGKQMNASFHKSWTKVRDSTRFQLVMEQIVHYITTYGYEFLGVYDKNTVYIPDEQLDVPDLEGDIKLTVIKGYTKKEIKQKLLDLLKRGIALKEDTVKDVVDVALFVKIKEKEIEQIRNKETKVILYDHLGKFPENPVEFLRFVIYKSTEKTLLIKNRDTTKAIKEEERKEVVRLFKKYERKHGLEKLSQIFFRYKPLFLAFKVNPRLRPIINQIRRLADLNHIPMKRDYLNDVTGKIKRGEAIVPEELKKALDRVNTFRKIRLAYALNFRTKDVDSILYKIRNSKGYAKSFSFDNKTEAKEALKIVIESIVEDIKKNVMDKRIYIPENLVYALPATEKQFTGNFPSGTHFTVPKNMIAGVHWENVGDCRVDLDLSLMSLKTGKIGWDSHYRTEDRTVLFSGDLIVLLRLRLM